MTSILKKRIDYRKQEAFESWGEIFVDVFMASFRNHRFDDSECGIEKHVACVTKGDLWGFNNTPYDLWDGVQELTTILTPEALAESIGIRIEFMDENVVCIHYAGK